MPTRTLPNTCSLLSSGKSSSLAYTVYAADGTISQARVYGQMTEIGTSALYTGPAIVVADTLAGYIVYDYDGTSGAVGTVVNAVEGFAALPNLANLDAAVSSRSVYAGGPVASVTSPVTVGTNNDKAGYALAAGTLVTVPSGSVKASPAPTGRAFTVTLTDVGESASLAGQSWEFQSGALAGKSGTILADTISGSDHALTFAGSAWPVAPTAGDTGVVI